MPNKYEMPDKYEIEKRIGTGSFGEVYLVKNNETKEFFAAKIEEKKKSNRLFNECKIYVNMQKRGFTEGLTKFYEYIETQLFNIMIIELLDISLDKTIIYKKRKTIEEIKKIGYDITCLLEKMHNSHYIHRDIKPNNFMYKDNKLYIMDFGLSKNYLVKGKHMNFRSDRSMIGTARYASINIHMGKEPSRRDDLESVSYMLIYFLIGTLPWQGLNKIEGKDHLENIGNVKLCTNMRKLCKDLPECFVKYNEYARSLSFEQKPNYDYLKSLML